VAGISGFKSWRTAENPSASFLRDWLEKANFTWLVTEDIFSEYKEVLTRLGVAPAHGTDENAEGDANKRRDERRLYAAKCASR